MNYVFCPKAGCWGHLGALWVRHPTLRHPDFGPGHHLRVMGSRLGAEHGNLLWVLCPSAPSPLCAHSCLEVSRLYRRRPHLYLPSCALLTHWQTCSGAERTVCSQGPRTSGVSSLALYQVLASLSAPRSGHILGPPAVSSHVERTGLSSGDGRFQSGGTRKHRPADVSQKQGVYIRPGTALHTSAPSRTRIPGESPQAGHHSGPILFPPTADVPSPLPLAPPMGATALGNTHWHTR